MLYEIQTDKFGGTESRLEVTRGDESYDSMITVSVWGNENF